jgi:AcrR family transcriptional regulator
MDSRTRAKILQAALHHLALFGEDKLSMSGVADEAKISRGTVYRYFANREDLLDGVADFVRQNFSDGVTTAAVAGGTTRAKLQRILRQRVDPETRQAVRRLRELQPNFTLAFLTEHMADFKALYTRMLAEDLADDELRLSPSVFVELLARVAVGETLFDDDPALVERLVLSVWDAMQPAAKTTKHAAGNGKRPDKKPADKQLADKQPTDKKANARIKSA